MRNPPAFQCYASDILASEEYKMASLEERGLFFTMAMQCWVSNSVPRNPPELAMLLGLNLADVEHALTTKVLRFFDEENGRLIRRELVEQKTEMIARREQQSQGGKTGASRRWKTKKKGIGNPMGKLSGDPIGPVEERRDVMRGGELNRKDECYYLDPTKTDEEVAREYREMFGEST